MSYLEIVASQNASDLHLCVGRPPIIRIDGKLFPVAGEEKLSDQAMIDITKAILNEEQQKKFQDAKQIDFSVDLHGKARFRANIYYQKGTISAAFRLIPTKIKTLDELNLPPALYELTKPSQGFVLITGPCGHGKSTTMAALIDQINHSRQDHIITIEDPIEYIFDPDMCIIDQREIFQDATAFGTALRAVFREDADVVMVGEMRDLETISTAITAAETGHLIFATLHTNDAAQTIDRMVDVFPSHQQNQIRMQLAQTLLGIVSQRLVGRTDGGRVPAVEILYNSNAVANLIREGKTHQINLVIETSREQGMVSLNNSLAELVKRGIVSFEEAETYSTNREELKILLR
ncbi:MAG: Pili biogenesis protein ATPase [Candidatus Moranbacteria bacterium GW2011_GWC1_45_18]|nr:MAG: Pili biogenesis protein ATPase [Candidatus Moranbacteria bacterium GW2011_GWC2_40_12]KKT34215.1 MAG: Pili biogenesis protein ATPase [Candidatus Moranbacteria bacterium GW2011_GWF2_44_10]KKU00575.1 MAG: Pili biogenesis protein ATPase [Candidatus Moranbacteria bacterium GW2011_GWC1_45_18]OGI36214.1 MAG: type IV pili twitching motility protein PilT [Candidatus Moranbacteria bacterium RIFOXYC1_FULL_44_8]OGI39138.1 MAG: type IV pili twitching motility protein PilT [Candidatus Moranbacteria b